MPTIGSETYRSTAPSPDVTKETYPSRSPTDAVRGPDMPETPAITALEPNTLTVDAPDTPIEVIGTGFNEKSVIVWNGGDEATSFIDEEHLSTICKPSTVQAPLPFACPVAVRNGELLFSNTLTFEFTEAEAPVRRKHGK